MAALAAVDTVDEVPDEIADATGVDAALIVPIGSVADSVVVAVDAPNIEVRSGREQAPKMTSSRHKAIRYVSALYRLIGSLIG